MTDIEWDDHIAVTPSGDGDYAAELTDGWVVGGGINGGYLLAIIGNALSQVAARQAGPDRRQRLLPVGLGARPGDGRRRA